MENAQLDQLVVEQNQHWQNPAIWEPTLSLKRDCFSPLWHDLIKNRLILTVNGPRRIGKSYLLKQLIANLIKTETVRPQNILYFSFNTGLNENDIVGQLVRFFINNFAKNNDQKYIFLDELQFISLWPDQIKAIYDLELPIKFVVTGSTSLFYRQKSKESLLGRLLKFPIGVLSFDEYLRFNHLNKPGSRAEFVSSLPMLRKEFRQYLTQGQLPEMVVDKNLNPKEYLAAISDQLLNFDIPYFHARIDRPLFFNLVKTLSFEIANEISVNKLAGGLTSSRAIIGDYIRILEETGYFSLCYNGFFKKMRAKVSGVKKMYSLNTNLSLAINGFDQSYFNDSRVLGHYAENYVYLRLKEKFGSRVDYFSDRKTETDFVTDDNVWEVKFGQIGDITKYQKVAEKLHKKLIIVTENEWENGSSVEKLPIYLL